MTNLIVAVITVKTRGADRINKIILLCGKSGSGKTTITDQLEQHGLSVLQSYTTRPKRSPDETGHTFVTSDEFAQLKDICAFGKFGGYEYGATREQVNQSDVYVIDAQGIEYFQKTYRGIKKPVVVYVRISPFRRLFRLLKRDGIKKGMKRWWQDIPHFFGIQSIAQYQVNNNVDSDRPAESIMSILYGGNNTSNTKK